MRNTGDDYFDSQEFRELLDEYEQAVSSGQPIFMDADELTDIADYYHFTGRTEEAGEAIERALELSPGAVAPLVYQAREALTREDVETAEALIEQIIDKNDPDYFYMQAELMIAKDDVEGADRFLRDYFMTVPPDEYDDFVLDVANIYLDYGLNEKAYEWMMRSRGNDSADFKELMGRTMFGLGKFKDSQRIFNELLDHNPYSKRYWNALASAQFMTEDYSESMTSSEYAIAIDPDDQEGILTKANSLYRLNNYEEALKYYQRYGELAGADDDFSELHQGICLVNLNRFDEAIQHLEQAAHREDELSPYKVQTLQELAFAYSAVHRVEDALQCLDQTKDMECDHIDMEVLRGHILLENDRFTEAEWVFRNAIIQSGSAPKILLRIIVSLYDNKFVEASYTMFKKYFEIVGDDADEGYAYMALCCWELKKQQEFMHYLRLAVQHNPQEARMVLNSLFPESMEPTEYEDYMKEKLSL